MLMHNHFLTSQVRPVCSFSIIQPLCSSSVIQSFSTVSREQDHQEKNVDCNLLRFGCSRSQIFSTKSYATNSCFVQPGMAYQQTSSQDSKPSNCTSSLDAHVQTPTSPEELKMKNA